MFYSIDGKSKDVVALVGYQILHPNCYGITYYRMRSLQTEEESLQTDAYDHLVQGIPFTKVSGFWRPDISKILKCKK